MREPGVHASTDFVKAACVYQAILAEAVAAILDLLHYPPPGANPGSGIPGQSLAGYPRTLALRGDPSPKPAGCGRVVPVFRRSRACREPGPGEADRGERDLRVDVRWHALPERPGGHLCWTRCTSSLRNDFQHYAGATGLPGRPPETGRPWRSLVLLLYPGADATEEDGRPARPGPAASRAGKGRPPPEK